MLVYLVNTLFKNNNVKESLLYADKLKAAMEEYNRLLYDKYLFFYYNSLVINYSKSDRDRTIEILEEMRTLEKIVAVPFYEVFIYLNLAVSYFDKKDFHQSIRSLNKLYLLKGFATTDKSLQFKIAIVELMIRYELKDFDVLENKIRLVKKDYAEFFKKKSNERDTLMVEIIQRLIKTDRLRSDKALMSQIKQLIISPANKEAADADILNYKNWTESLL
jgi:tetratricopeptide (TPR) repeat protein